MKAAAVLRDEDREARLLTVPELAGRLAVPVSWVYGKVEAGELPYFKIGRHVRFELRAVEDYLRAQRRGPRAL